MAPSLSPKLASLRDEMDATTAEMHRLVDPLDEATWQRRADAGRWSVAECIEHLNMTSAAFTPLLRERIRDARERGLSATDPHYRLDLFGWFLCRSLEPPPRRRFRTTGPFVPPGVKPREMAVRSWEHHQRDLAALLVEAEGVALTRVKITSPFNARIRYNAYSALRIVLAHQRRHLWQAAKALEE